MQPRQSNYAKPAVLIATLALCLIPCVGIGAVVASATILSQLPTGVNEVAAQLADKSIAYWFLTLAGVAIASWTWIFKWLLNQLELQRQAHAATTAELISFMKEDHATAAAQISSSQAVIATNQQALSANQQALTANQQALSTLAETLKK